MFLFLEQHINDNEYKLLFLTWHLKSFLSINGFSNVASGHCYRQMPPYKHRIYMADIRYGFVCAPIIFRSCWSVCRIHCTDTAVLWNACAYGFCASSAWWSVSDTGYICMAAPAYETECAPSNFRSRRTICRNDRTHMVSRLCGGAHAKLYCLVDGIAGRSNDICSAWDSNGSRSVCADQSAPWTVIHIFRTGIWKQKEPILRAIPKLCGDKESNLYGLSSVLCSISCEFRSSCDLNCLKQYSHWFWTSSPNTSAT